MQIQGYVAGKVSRSFTYLALAQALNGAVNFVVLALYSKYLSPSDFGRISLIWIFVMVASIVIDGRMNSSFCIRYYKDEKIVSTKRVYTIFTYYLIALLIAAIIFLSVPGAIGKMINVSIGRSGIFAVLLLIGSMLISNFYFSYLLIRRSAGEYLLMRVLFSALLVISSLVLMKPLNLGYIAYIWAYFAANSLVAVVGAVRLLRDFPPIGWAVLSFVELKRMLKIGFPLIFDGLLLFMITWADRYILSLYTSLAVVGIYSVGYRFAEIINTFIIVPFGQSITPVLFSHYADSFDKYRQTMRRIFKYYWLAILGITLTYFAVLKEAFDLVLETKYARGYSIVIIVLFGIIFFGIASLINSSVMLKEKTGRMFLITLTSVISNIAFCLFLIPRYGMYGAAYATLISYMVYFSIVLFYSQSLLHVDYDYKYVIKTVLLTTPFFLLVFTVTHLGVGTIPVLLFKMFILVAYAYCSYHFLDVGRTIVKLREGIQ